MAKSSPLSRAPMDPMPVMDPDEEVLTVHETAARFRVTPGTVYRALTAGTFPCRALLVGRRWRISAADVDAVLASRAAELEGPIE